MIIIKYGFLQKDQTEIGASIKRLAWDSSSPDKDYFCHLT